jgi:hypothetical protein
LTPTVDEHSIKVEGTGSAIITDIAVELLPNREIFQDIYPDSDDEKSDCETEEEEEEERADSAEIVTVRDKLFLLRDEQKRAKEIVASAESRLKFLDSYGKMLDRKRGVEIDNGLETYRTEREKVFDDHMKGLIRDRELSKEIIEAMRTEAKLVKLQNKEQVKIEKAKAKIRRAKEKEKEKVARREAERQKEKDRICKEREHFWPKVCYSVRITLDATIFTPSSSRRGSIASATDLVKVAPSDLKQAQDDELPLDSLTCDLSISYVTTSAFWAPSYDLQLSTTNNTAMLCFDAQLTNATSETWTNSKVTLSTSQTTFSGLEDAIPTLAPWRIKLASRGSGIVMNDILDSREERAQQGQWKSKQQMQHVQKPRSNLFGVGGSNNIDAWNNVNERVQMSKGGAPQLQMQQMQMQMPIQPPAPFGAASANVLMQSNNINRPRMAASMAAPGSSVVGGLAFASKKMSKSRGGGGADMRRTRASADIYDHDETDREEEAADEDDCGDDGTILPEPQPELDFQESAMEETGFTTTYDLPGLKTLPPRSTASKQRVARLNFTGVAFSHTVIAKYKPAAYLKAKLKNNSKLTLLKGAAGLTLDGSFMGRTSLPRCSAGDTFTMSLGIDPAVKVIYPKPDVRRATTGLFSKEDSSSYLRTITIANSRASGGKAINILVLDQVPVSEDERLRVEILAPRGMAIGGNGVLVGVPGRDTKDDKDWGKATASLKKAGEVSWDVVLNPGKAVKLGLDYVVAAPSGDYAVQC